MTSTAVQPGRDSPHGMAAHSPSHRDPAAPLLSEDDAVREIKQSFRHGHYDKCQAVYRRVDAQGGWSDKKRGEEALWLRGMIDKRKDRYEAAIENFDKALDYSVSLHQNGLRAPSKECMEVLKARGICNLYLHKYQSAIRDFKEWLKLHAAFWPKTCPTLAYYNLGLCYKYIYVFDAAQSYFKLAEKSAGAQEDSKTRASYLDKACNGLRVVEELEAARDEAEVLKDIERLYPGIEGIDLDSITDNYSVVPDLLVLRTKIHYHLAHASWAFLEKQQALESFAQNTLKERPARSRWFQWSTQPQDSVTLRHTSAIKEVVAAFLSKLTGVSESKIRKNLNSPNNIHLPSGTNVTVKGIKRQCIKFACEFVMNHMNMFVWSSVQLTPESVMLLRSIDEHPPILPFLRGNEARKIAKKHDDGADPGVDFDDVEAIDDVSEPIVDQECRKNDFIPSCRHCMGEKPLLNEVQRSGVCRILPIRNCMQHWNLCYSTNVHGFLFSTFLGLTSNIGPNLVIVKTLNGEIFGGFTACSWYPDRNHFGNGETRVFSVKGDEVKGYSWTCLNRYFVRCSEDSLCFGGGSSHAFSIDGHDLATGSTGYCPTFDSPSLCSEMRYDIQHVECWSFVAEGSSVGGSFRQDPFDVAESFQSTSAWQRA
eukprot:TRINITY_DN18065_c0_g1_i1.p1 TRINITY_DN18065_c0_g1~~TRINITY_DN18065_c0_g1_i1.p1  ORF type:complete len:651 (+),score=192.08 TRINITY_DN18065_c0_g1_i1:92-2044(+)